MTPAERNDAWRELTAIYMPWMKLDDIPFYGEGRAWQRQHHIYESPFYYIDYCLAQTVSLQFWAEIQKDSKAAWEKYMAYTRPAGTKTFKELVAGRRPRLPLRRGRHARDSLRRRRLAGKIRPHRPHLTRLRQAALGCKCATRRAERRPPRGGQCHPISLVLPKETGVAPQRKTPRLRLEADALRASLTEAIRW